MPFTILTMASLGSMVQRGLVARHHFMGGRRRVTLSGAVVVSTAEGSGKINAWITPEDGTMIDGDDRF